MHVVIIGAGVTGVELARRLIAKKHTVVLVEHLEEAARHAANRLDCTVTQASGNDPQVLKDANIKKADVLVTVTESDELNMLICGVAHAMAPTVLKIARVRNETYASSISNAKEHMLGVDFFVHPDQEAAKAIVNAVQYGAVSEITVLENAPYQLIGFTIEKDSNLDGIRVQEVRKLVDIPFVAVSVESQGHAFIPSGKTILSSGMRIFILTLPEHISIFYNLGGCKLKSLKKIVLVGMGKVGKRVASLLSEQKSYGLLNKLFRRQAKQRWELTIIDKNPALAKYAAAHYPNARVYRGDITDESFIQEIDLESCDLLITATQKYELNMITAVYFKTLGIPKTIALLQSAVMSNVAYKIGVDVAVPLKDVTVDTIMSHLGGKNLTRIHTMGSGNLEIIEIIIGEESQAIHKPLKDISRHGLFLILLVTNHDGCHIPDGNTLLEPNDKIAVIIEAEKNDHIIKYFSGAK